MDLIEFRVTKKPVVSAVADTGEAYERLGAKSLNFGSLVSIWT